MKCPTCGYFNFPGVTQCGQCNRPLSEAAPSNTGTAAPAVPLAEIYPPRARDRRFSENVQVKTAQVRRHLRTRISPQARLEQFRNRRLTRGQRIQRLPDPVLVRVHRDSSSVSVRERLDWREWIAPILSIVPGLGQWFQKRYQIALMLNVGLLAWFIAAFFTWYHPLTNAMLYLLGALVMASIYDAGHHSFPRLEASQTGETMRRIRLFLLAMTMTVGTYFLILLAASNRYGWYEIQNQFAAPLFLGGDQVLVEFVARPSQLQRGDLIIHQTAERLDRIIGVAGDQVELKNDRLFVNGRPVSRQQYPLVFRPGAGDFSIVVPKGQLCLWQEATNVGEGGPQFLPYVMVDAAEVAGRPVAIMQPPQRRQWMD